MTYIALCFGVLIGAAAMYAFTESRVIEANRERDAAKTALAATAHRLELIEGHRDHLLVFVSGLSAADFEAKPADPTGGFKVAWLSSRIPEFSNN